MEKSSAPLRSRLTRPALLRLGVLALLLLIGLVVVQRTEVGGYLDEDRLAELLRALGERPAAPAGLVLLYLVLCPLGAPVTPLILAGGAVFGTWLGALLNFLGTVLGGTFTFTLARALGRPAVVELVGRHERTLRRAVRRHGFWAMVRLRYVPLPFAVANVGAALAGVRPSVFVTSTSLALAPSMVVYSYFGALLGSAASGDRAGVVLKLLLFMTLLLTLTFVPTCWLRLERARRYRQLRAARTLPAASRPG